MNEIFVVDVEGDGWEHEYLYLEKENPVCRPCFYGATRIMDLKINVIKKQE